MKNIAIILCVVVCCLKPQFSFATSIESIGFETGTTDETFSIKGTGSFSSSVSNTGTYSLEINPTGTGVGYVSIRGYDPTTHLGGRSSGNFDEATAYYNVYFRYATKPSSGDEPILVPVGSAGTTKAELRLNSDGKLKLYDNSASLLGTSATALSQNTWYHLCLKVGTGASASYDLQVNGTSEVSGTGNLYTDNNAVLRVGKLLDRNGNTVDVFYDDLYISNSSCYNGAKIVYLYPNAAGTDTGFGDVYTNVNEVPTDENNYIQSTAASDTFTNNLQNTSFSGTIVSARVWTRFAGLGPGSVGSARVRSGGTTSNTTAHAMLSGTRSSEGDFYDTDPNTGSAWTTAALDSVQIGFVEDSSSTDRIRVYEHALAVVYTPAAASTEVGRPRTLRLGTLLLLRGKLIIY